MERLGTTGRKSRPESRDASQLGWTVGIAIACLIAVVATGLLASTGQGSELNVAVLTDLHATLSLQWLPAAAIISAATEPWLTGLLGLFLAARLIIYRALRAEGIALAGVTILAEALTEGLKVAFREARPHLFAGPVHEAGFSFPSGHTLVITALSSVLAYLWSRREPSRRFTVLGWVMAIALPAVVGADRLYLVVHWPLDVGAGYLGGIGCASIGIAALNAGWHKPRTLVDATGDPGDGHSARPR